MICHYWFFNHEFKLQDSLCHHCQDLRMCFRNVSDIAIITVNSFIKKNLYLQIMGIYKMHNKRNQYLKQIRLSL